MNQRPLGYEPFSSRDGNQRATNNTSSISAFHVRGFGGSLALVGSNFLGNSWVKSGRLRIAPPRKHTSAPTQEVGAPQTSKRGSGRRCACYSPVLAMRPNKVGALGGWNHRRGRQRRCRRPLPGRVECPPCASTYSPGAPQSSGSPACSVVSRLMWKLGSAFRFPRLRRPPAKWP